MTITLLLNSEGKKMGKTQSGAVWLDPNKTSPFDFYQYWRNVNDADVIKCMRLLTFLPLEEIDEMAKWEGSELNKAKEILAYQLTELVHGEEEAKKAQEGARARCSQVQIPSSYAYNRAFRGGHTDGKEESNTIRMYKSRAGTKPFRGSPCDPAGWCIHRW